MKHIKKCGGCGKYTLQGECCGPTSIPRPAKYNPEDKYAKYRRKAKQQKEET